MTEGISVKVEGFGKVVPGVRPQTKPDGIGRKASVTVRLIYQHSALNVRERGRGSDLEHAAASRTLVRETG